LVESLNKSLIPKLDDFVKKFDSEGWGKKLEDFAENVGGWISTIGGWIMEHPKLTAAIWAFSKAAPLIGGAFKLLGGLWDMGKWFMNGVALGKGVDSVASGNNSINTTKVKGSGKFGKFGKTKGGMSLGRSLSKGVKVGGGLGLLGLGADMGRSFMDNPDSTGGKTLGAIGTTANWAGTGAMIGSVIPGLGTAAGAIIGGLLGAGKGVYDEFINVNDGIVKFNPKDKFIGIGNDTIVAGTDAGGNRALANQIAGGSTGGKTEVIHKHEDMKITFEFVGLSESTARDLLSNSRFLKDMNSRLNEISSSVFSGGKLSPNPKFSN